MRSSAAIPFVAEPTTSKSALSNEINFSKSRVIVSDDYASFSCQDASDGTGRQRFPQKRNSVNIRALNRLNLKSFNDSDRIKTNWRKRLREQGEAIFHDDLLACGRGCLCDEQTELRMPAKLRADVFVEPVDSPLPCKLRGGFVITFRRGIAEEAVARVGIDVSLMRNARRG